MISVVIPVRDGALYVEEAIRSALGQPETSEVVVVDDGSTDETADVVRSIDDARILYRHQPAAGAAAARNRGAAAASQAFLAFLDADDIWLPGKLASQHAALSADEGDLIFSSIEEFVSPELPAEEAAALRPRPGALRGVSITTLLMRAADFERVGAFDPDIRVGEFLEWFARARQLGLRSHIIPQVLTRRRLHRNNQGRTNKDARGQYASILRAMLQQRRATEGK